MGQVASLPLDFNPWHLFKVDFHHHNHHHGHHKTTNFNEAKPPHAEKSSDEPDPNIDYTKPPAKEETCCCTEVYVEKVPPGGEVRLVPPGPMLYHPFDYAEASNSCDASTHGPDMALDSSGHYWCSPGYQLDNAGKAIPQTVTYTAGLLGNTGRFPAYGIQIDFAHLPAVINGVRIQSYEHGEWQDMIKQSYMSEVFGKNVDKGSVFIAFPAQQNIHEVQIGLTGAMNQNFKTMAIQRIELVESNPSGMNTDGNFDTVHAYWQAKINNTTQAHELGVAEGVIKPGTGVGAARMNTVSFQQPTKPTQAQQQLMANGNMAQQPAQVYNPAVAQQQAMQQGMSQMFGAVGL